MMEKQGRIIRGVKLLESLFHDLVYAARMQLKQPGSTIVAVLVLALGIGANTIIFSVVNTVLLQPLPYPGADRLVIVQEGERGKLPQGFLTHHYPPLLDQNRVLEQSSAYMPVKLTLTGRSRPEELRGKKITNNFFPLFSVRPLFGRVFDLEEYQEGRDQVTLISHHLWMQQFGADTGLVGQTIILDDQKYTVIGIMPQHFLFEPGDDFWIPMTFSSMELAGQHGSGVSWGPGILGKLRIGITALQAEKELTAIVHRLQWPSWTPKEGYAVKLDSLHELMVKDVQQRLILSWGAVGVVLLVSCASIANMMLARGVARQKEIAIRAALGAGRNRIARQLMTESILLALLGGTVGLLLSLWGIKLFVVLAPQDIPRLSEIGINGHVLLFTLLISLTTSVIFGLAPALRYSKADLNHMLKEGTNASTVGFQLLGRHRVHSALTVLQIALATVLLAGAGLLIRSFQRLQDLHLGYQPERVLTAQLGLPWKKYGEPQQMINFSHRLVAALEVLPGVESVGITSTLPLGVYDHKDDLPIAPPPPPSLDGTPGTSIAPRTKTYVTTISPNYFRTMGIQLKRGREFAEQDNENALPVAIVSETLAQVFWPGEDALGQRIQMTPSTLAVIVGVVSDVRHSQLQKGLLPEVYYPHVQIVSRESLKPSAEFIKKAKPVKWLNLVIRVKGRPDDLVAAVSDKILLLDPDQPINNVKPMTNLYNDKLSSRRFNMLLFGAFACAALLLASIGIYGVISFSVAQRINEIGIRIALGAKRTDVLWLIIGQGVSLTLFGLGIGLGAAFGLTRLIKSLLYGVSATDPATLVTISTLITIVALCACYLPARKATRIDPLLALRSE
jgi:putative ABC transport system permease protein